MKNRRYRRWNEILNPALERAMRQNEENPYKMEILKALDGDLKKKHNNTGTPTDQETSSSHDTRLLVKNEKTNYSISAAGEKRPGALETKTDKGNNTELEKLFGEFIRWKERMRK